MKENIILNTKHGNRYLYSYSLKKIIYLPSDFALVVDAYIKHKDIETVQSIFKNQKYGYYINKLRHFIELGIICELKHELIPIKGDEIERYLLKNKFFIIEATERCNLNCTYCSYGRFYSIYGKREGIDVNFNKVKEVFNYIFSFTKNGHFSHEIRINFYGGEPLLMMDSIKEFVSFLKERWPDQVFVFGMTTNGVILDKYIDFLIEQNFSLLISLDGDEKCNKHRVFPNGNESFGLVYKNIKKLQLAYPKYFKTNVNISTVIHSESNSEEINIFMRDNFNKKPLTGKVREEGVVSIHKEEFDKLLKSKQKYIKDNLKFILYNCNYSNKTYLDLLNSSNNNSSCKSKTLQDTCIPLESRFYITAKGHIYPCEKLSTFFQVGTFSENKPFEIDYDEVADRYNEFFKTASKQCYNCYETNCHLCVYRNMDSKNRINCLFFVSRNNFISRMIEALNKIEENPKLLKIE